MKTAQYLGLLATVFTGCALGAWMALRPQVAHAQVNNVRTEEYLSIPNGGLQLRTNQGRVIGMIGESGGSGMIALFASDGKPSLQLFGGTGGQISLGTAGGSSGLHIKGPKDEQAQLLAQGGSSWVSVGTSKSSAQLTGGQDFRLMLPNGQGRPVAELQSTVEGAFLRLSGANKAMVEVNSSSTRGLMKLFAREGETEVSLDGMGTIQISKENLPLFKAPLPPKEDGQPEL